MDSSGLHDESLLNPFVWYFWRLAGAMHRSAVRKPAALQLVALLPRLPLQCTELLTGCMGMR
jgi:hypothetical protein